ncbi:MAG: hypothetical protein ABI779_18860 [Acidobacteriota bacterium]
MIWRERRTLLIILGVLLLANLVFFLTYRIQYQSRLDDMDSRLAQVEGQLAQAHKSRLQAEQSLVAYRRVEKDVQAILEDRWSTQPRRLTLFISEVKRLARASNAIPTTLSFTRNESKAAGSKSEGVGAKEVGVAFNVDATYDQARRMINLFELSEQFVIIDQISLTDAGENRLSFSLRIKTLFREDPAPATNNRS